MEAERAQDEHRAGTNGDSPLPRNTRSRRASWRRRSDSPFGVTDSESGSAATRPVSATERKSA